MDLPQLKLLIGTHRGATAEEQAKFPMASPTPFLHCWTETTGGRVISPTSFEAANRKLVSWSKAEYYAAIGSRDYLEVPRSTLMAIAKKCGWSKHFLRNDPPILPVGLPIQLLDALKFPYRINDWGGLIPAH
jgi:hypothetical protein